MDYFVSAHPDQGVGGVTFKHVMAFSLWVFHPKKVKSHERAIQIVKEEGPCGPGLRIHSVYIIIIYYIGCIIYIIRYYINTYIYYISYNITILYNI